MSSALWIRSVDALIACKDLQELASSAALLARRLLSVRDAVVLLRSAEREFISAPDSESAELVPWAAELLAGLPHQARPSSGPLRAAAIQPSDVDVRGVLAVLLEPSSSGAQQQDTMQPDALLPALADLIATCAAQLVQRTRADRTLQETRALVARGLHDLCTPLNSLRLGMHLLEPALTTQDPAVAQRAHRAVDRMAALVTGMAEAISAGNAGGQNGSSMRPASAT